MNRKASYITVCKSGTFIESYWDKSLRSWTTLVKKPIRGYISEGDQIGEAEYDANRESMEHSHNLSVAKEGGVAPSWGKPMQKRWL